MPALEVRCSPRGLVNWKQRALSAVVHIGVEKEHSLAFRIAQAAVLYVDLQLRQEMYASYVICNYLIFYLLQDICHRDSVNMLARSVFFEEPLAVVLGVEKQVHDTLNAACNSGGCGICRLQWRFVSVATIRALTRF